MASCARLRIERSRGRGHCVGNTDQEVGNQAISFQVVSFRGEIKLEPRPV